jgi:phosphoglycolate phosphatase
MRRGSVSEQLVLWDIDGTLLNADGVGRDLYDVVFVQLFGRSIDAFAPMAGRTDRAIILETLTMAGVDEPRRYVDPFIAGLTAQAPSVREMVAVRGRALPGASEVLRGLQGRAHQSVLTGNIRPVAEVKLAAVGLRDGLDLCIGAYGDDHEIRAELVPVARRRAAAVHGKSPAEFDGAATVVIGDTPLDIEAALASGARAIGVATGGYTAGELAAAGAHAVLPDLTDTDAVLRALLLSATPSCGTWLAFLGCLPEIAGLGWGPRLPSLLADLPRPRRPRRSASKV